MSEQASGDDQSRRAADVDKESLRHPDRLTVAAETAFEVFRTYPHCPPIPWGVEGLESNYQAAMKAALQAVGFDGSGHLTQV